MSTETTPALEIRHLSVRIGDRWLLSDVSLVLDKGTILGLVGASGSGKTTVALASMGLVPAPAEVSGSILVCGSEIVGSPDAALAAIRGSKIAMIFQDPLSALDPTMRVGKQVAEALSIHTKLPRRQIREVVEALLSSVGFSDVDIVYRRYPHQLSGGQRQRIAIAMALVGQPPVVIADEPTASLDAAIERQVLQLLIEQVQELGASLLLISHDIAMVTDIADTIAVMLEGQILEIGPGSEVSAHPSHPYTQALVDAARIFHDPDAELSHTPELVGESPFGINDSLTEISSVVPPLTEPPLGSVTPAGGGEGTALLCPYRQRCRLASEICCSVAPPLHQVGGGFVRCHHPIDHLRPSPTWESS